MAFPVSGQFDYLLGGRPLVTLAKDTGNLDYWLGGRPIVVLASAAAVVTPPVTPPATTPDVGGIGRGHGRRRHRITVEIDGQEFEVRSQQEGIELLMQARKLAEQAAQAAAERAAAKAASKAKPAAQQRALAIPVPEITLSGDDGSELAQQMQASVDAANAHIEAVYQAAMAVARRRAMEMIQDEEDAITLLLLS